LVPKGSSAPTGATGTGMLRKIRAIGAGIGPA
jgi:hypothetical protein